MSGTDLIRGCVIVGLSVGVLGLGVCGAVLYFAPAPKTTAAQKPTPRPTTNTKRIWLENSRWDDSTRAFIAQTVLKKNGQRCDSVTSAVMHGPGDWRILCAPGYNYRFVFDAEGRLSEAYHTGMGSVR